jgi:hypothetical protein
MDEERERLRRERGEPEPVPLTPEQEAEREAWIEEMNAAAEEALEELEADHWKGERRFRDRDHPLVTHCREFSLRIHHEAEDGGWLTDDAPDEHPVREVVESWMIAGAKLAGALNSTAEEGWPPEKLFAGDTLVRLKKARDLLRDAIRGLDAADEENLAPATWRIEVRRETGETLSKVQELVHEIRQVLGEEDAEGED